MRVSSFSEELAFAISEQGAQPTPQKHGSTQIGGNLK